MLIIYGWSNNMRLTILVFFGDSPLLRALNVNAFLHDRNALQLVYIDAICTAEQSGSVTQREHDA